MMTVNEVSRIANVSVRTLQYYDKIGLLKPSGKTEAGYRLYDEDSLQTLQEILLFRELEFPLKQIKEIMSSPNYDRKLALNQQIELLTMKMERTQKLINLAREIKDSGEINVNFEAFDDGKIQEYSQKAKELWGDTSAYREYQQKTEDRTNENEKLIADGLMEIFKEFGAVRHDTPFSTHAQLLVTKLKNYITANYYECTNEILSSLGEMYRTEEFKSNIDAEAGNGTAEFVAEAILIYCI